MKVKDLTGLSTEEILREVVRREEDALAFYRELRTSVNPNVARILGRLEEQHHACFKELAALLEDEEELRDLTDGMAD